MTLSEWMYTQRIRDLEVANLVNINRATVSRLRRGERLPAPRLMKVFADVTDGWVLPNDWFPDLPIPVSFKGTPCHPDRIAAGDSR